MARNRGVRLSSSLLTALIACSALIPLSFGAEEPLHELRVPGVPIEVEPRPDLGFAVPPSAYPLHPVEQLAFNGARHGLVNTTTGGMTFRVWDMKLPGRMPIEIGRIYDSKFTDSLPPLSPGMETLARWTPDLGASWIANHTAYLLNMGDGSYLMATQEGDVIRWIDNGDDTFTRDTKSPSKHWKLERTSPIEIVETQIDGTTWTFTESIMTGVTYALTKVEDENGNYIQYIYQSGYLRLIKNSDNAVAIIDRPIYSESPPYSITPPDRIKSISDTTGRTVSYGYDAYGRLIQVTDLSGKNWTYSYNTEHKITAAVDPLQNEYLTAAYDTSNRVASYEANEGPWVFLYWTAGDRTEVFDGLNQMWKYEYDASGITTKITEPTGGVHEWTLDNAKNPQSYTSPVGGVSSWTYDAEYRPTTHSPAGMTGTITYHYSHTNPWVDSVDALDGSTTTFTRDNAGRVLTETTPDNAQWSSTYAGNGDRLTLKLPKGNEPGATDDFEWSFGYDGKGQRITATDPTGRVFEFDYTVAGDLEKIRQPDHDDGAGGVVNAEWTYNRDASGRITSEVNPVGNTWTRTYDDAGRLIRTEGEMGTARVYGYDARYRLTSVTIEDGVNDPTTTYGYDAAGRLFTKTLPNGAIWTYGYDNSSRLNSITDPLQRSWTFGRDAAGKVTSKTFPGGQQLTFLRDTAGRLTQRTLPDGRIDTYTYDAANGRLTQAESNENSGAWIGRLSWDYDGLGRPTSIKTYVNDGTEVQDHELLIGYDANGNRDALSHIYNTIPGENITYSYDELDRLIGTDSDTEDDWTVTYDPYSGHRTYAGAGQGANLRWRQWAYDMAGRLNAESWDSPGVTSGSFGYNYDPESRRTYENDLTNGVVQDITFGPHNLPVTMARDDGTGAIWMNFTYDDLGQVIRKERVEGATITEESVFDWDDAGRLTYSRKGDDVRVLTWDDQPSTLSSSQRVWRGSTSPNEATRELLYDYDGRLIHIVGHSPEEQNPVSIADYRWAPVSLDQPLEVNRRLPDGSYEQWWLVADTGGSFAESDAGGSALRSVNPVHANDRAGQILTGRAGSSMPDLLGPFSNPGWKGFVRTEARSSGIVEQVTGLVEGRRGVSFSLARERIQPRALSVFDEARPILSNWIDEFSGERLAPSDGGQPSWPVTAFTPRPTTVVIPVTGCICDMTFDLVASNADPPRETPRIFTDEGVVSYVVDMQVTDECCGATTEPDCDFDFDQAASDPPSVREGDHLRHGASLLTGDRIEEATDLVVYDSGGAIEFRRTYRSLVTHEGSLGYRWFHNWEEKLVFGQGADPRCGDLVRWVNPDGTFVEFWFDQYGEPHAPDDSPYRIRRDWLGEYDVRTLGGGLRHFNSSGRLESIREGSLFLSFVYDEEQLVRIQSGGVDRILLYYDEHDRLRKVQHGSDTTDPGSPPVRGVEYFYDDSCGRLERVLGPAPDVGYDAAGPGSSAVKVTSPVRRETLYSYTDYSEDCDTSSAGFHLLESVQVAQWNPLDASFTSPETVTSTKYDLAWRLNSPSFAKVIGQCIHRGNCQTETTGSEDIQFAYTWYPFSNQTEVTVTDSRTPGESISTLFEFYSGKLTRLVESVGDANRETTYEYFGDLQSRVDHPDGTCATTQYVRVAGVYLPQLTRTMNPDRCDDPAAGGIPDRVTYREFEPYGGQVLWEASPEAFPDGIVPASPDPNSPDIEPFVTWFYYDYDEGYPVGGVVEEQCTNWSEVVCPSAAVDRNSEPGDDNNEYGNLVASRVSDPTTVGGGIWIRHSYTPEGRLWKEAAPSGARTEKVYYADATGPWSIGDPVSSGGTVAYGPLAETRSQGSGGEEGPTGKYAWNEFGESILTVSPSLVHKQIERGNTGRILRRIMSRSATDPSDGCGTGAATVLRSTESLYDLRRGLIQDTTRDEQGTVVSRTHFSSRDFSSGTRRTRTVDPEPASVPGDPRSSSPGSEPFLHLRSREFVDPRGRSFKFVSPEGRVSCNVYDALGRVTQERVYNAWHDEAGDQFVCPVDDDDDVDGLDRVSEYIVDVMGRVFVTRTKLNASEWREVYRWYDEFGRLQFESDGKPSGARDPVLDSSIVPPSPQTATWYREFSYDGRTPSTDPFCQRCTVDRVRFFGSNDPSQETVRDTGFLQVSWTTRDTLGRIVETATAITKPGGTSSTAYVEASAADLVLPQLTNQQHVDIARIRYRFDSLGRLDTVEDHRVDAGEPFRKYELEYDSFDRIKKTIDPSEGGSAQDHTEYQYADGTGWLTAVTVTKHDPDGVAHTHEVETRYDVWGRACETVAAPEGERLRDVMEYDSLNRPYRMIRKWAVDGDYGNLGQHDRVEEAGFDRAGRLEWTQTRTKVDQGNSVWSRVAVKYDRDGLQTELTDGEQRVTTWDYNPLGLLETVRYPGPATLRQTVRFEYDGASRLIDRWQHETESTSSAAVHHQLSYYTYGPLKERSAALLNPGESTPVFKGAIRQIFDYDSLGRFVVGADIQESPGGPDEEVIVRWGFDSGSRIVSDTQIAPFSGGSLARVLNATYHLDGTRSSLEFPQNGPNPLYRYSLTQDVDYRGRVASLIGPAQPAESPSGAIDELASYAYIGDLLWTRSFPNGTALYLHSRDDLGREVSQDHDIEAGANAGDFVARFVYGFDRIGNRSYELRKHEGLGGDAYNSRAYTVDLSGRLEKWRDGNIALSSLIPPTEPDPTNVLQVIRDGEEWELDKTGNWKTQTTGVGASEIVLGYTSNGLDQYESIQLPSGASSSQEHDWLGQRTYDERNREQGYVWDLFGRLAEVNDSSGSPVASYRYDVFNRRVEAVSHGAPPSVVHFVYDGWQVVEEREVVDDGTTSHDLVEARYGFDLSRNEVLWMDRRPVTPVTGGAPTVGGWSRYFVHHDARGSAVALTKDRDISTSEPIDVVERYTYKAYGETSVWNDAWSQSSGSYGENSLSESTVSFPYLFGGQRWDPNTKLYYFKNRYYDPVDGRFLSRDPSGYSDGPNLYQYVRSRPQSLVDPLGLYSCLTPVDCGGGSGRPPGPDVPPFPRTSPDENPARAEREWIAYILWVNSPQGLYSSDVEGSDTSSEEDDDDFEYPEGPYYLEIVNLDTPANEEPEEEKEKSRFWRGVFDWIFGWGRDTGAEAEFTKADHGAELVDDIGENVARYYDTPRSREGVKDYSTYVAGEMIEAAATEAVLSAAPPLRIVPGKGKLVAKLTRPLRSKMKRLSNAIAAGGNRGIPGAVSAADALKLGERFVGPNSRLMSNGRGLISEDGLRQFRFGAKKRGVNPQTGERYSKTGVQVNFQSRDTASGPFTSNVHLDVTIP